MNKYIFLVICMFSFAASASQKAVTDEGEIVILNTNGTWVYQNSGAEQTDQIFENTNTFTKGKELNFDLKSVTNDAKFSINPKAWTFKKGNDAQNAEFELKLKGGDLYGMAITERMVVPMAGLGEVVQQNMLDLVPNATIVKQEYRIVNGNKVVYVEITGSISGINAKYFGYLHSNKSGTTQYIAYTGENLEDKYKSDIDDFLNGFSMQ
jgi:hypothetical protein